MKTPREWADEVFRRAETRAVPHAVEYALLQVLAEVQDEARREADTEWRDAMSGLRRTRPHINTSQVH